MCQTTKQWTERKAGLLHQLPILETPWSLISMDFVGPFPLSLNYNYLWVVMCWLTSQVHLIPVKMMINVLKLTHEFLKGVVHLHRLPKSIVLDCDTKFTSRFWTELHRLLGVKLKLTTTFHLEGNGRAEQIVQNVTKYSCPKTHSNVWSLWVWRLIAPQKPISKFPKNHGTCASISPKYLEIT